MKLPMQVYAGQVQQWELVDALREATEILEAEFADTDGGGRKALLKCRSVLARATSSRMEQRGLPLSSGPLA